MRQLRLPWHITHTRVRAELGWHSRTLFTFIHLLTAHLLTPLMGLLVGSPGPPSAERKSHSLKPAREAGALSFLQSLELPQLHD